MRNESESNAKEPRATQRRTFLKQAGAAAIMSLVPPAVRSGAWAAGSDAPEKKQVRIGFIPLTDCSSVLMAALQGFDKKYGIEIVPCRETSWAAVRDKLLNGELDAAHVLYGLVYGVQTGIAGPKRDMAILMGLNHNGQAITLSSRLHEKGVTDGASLKALMDRERRHYAFAHTFPTGTHAMWMCYWLAACGINPFADVVTITVPPPQMVATMRAGSFDGYCAGEPWNNSAIVDKIGFTANTSQDIWRDHPEKVLACTAEFVRNCPNAARAMTAAIIEAGRWIDSSPSARRTTAEILAGDAYVNCDKEVILERMLGHYDNGIGKTWDDPNGMKFYNDGYVTFPFPSDGIWFMTQHRRWGLLKENVDYWGIAKQVHRIDIYSDAAAATATSLPGSSSRSATLIDGVVWDGTDPQRYAEAFGIKVA